MKRRLSRAVVATTTAAAMGWLAAPASAHGVVGDRMFMEPLVAEDANPANEMDLLVPAWQAGTGFSEGFAIEKTLLPNLSIGLAGAWSPGGFEQPSLSLKNSLVRSDAHEVIASIGLAVAPPVFPTSGTYWNLGPTLAFAKGFGDLPDAVGALRPFMLQGDIDGDIPVGNGSSDGATDVNFKLALAYSLPYLQQEVQYLGIPAPLSQLMPQVEIDLDQPIAGPGGTLFNGRVLPGVMWVGNYAELGVAAVLPLNDQSGGFGAMAILDIFLDDVFPFSYGRPLLGPVPRRK